jgi:hypothetical protein
VLQVFAVIAIVLAVFAPAFPKTSIEPYPGNAVTAERADRGTGQD